MSYSGVATAAIGLALLAVAVAAVAGVLWSLGRRRSAERTLPAFLAVVAGAILLSFVAVAQSDGDLQRQARRTLAFASAAERTQFARSGNYTTSVIRLERLNRGLEVEVKSDGAEVHVTRGPGARTVRISVTLGPGSLAKETLRSGARFEGAVRHRGSPSA